MLDTTPTEQPQRNAIAEALASIPRDVLGRIEAAKVAGLAIGDRDAGCWRRAVAPPLRLEDALALVAAGTSGRVRAAALELTDGSCVWLGARLRFAFVEPPGDVATRRAAVESQGDVPPPPRVRAWR